MCKILTPNNSSVIPLIPHAIIGDVYGPNPEFLGWLESNDYGVTNWDNPRLQTLFLIECLAKSPRANWQSEGF